MARKQSRPSRESKLKRPKSVRQGKASSDTGRPNPVPQGKPKPAAPVVQPKPPMVSTREKGRAANNTTCDIYYAGNAPAAAPDVAGAACALVARFAAGQEASEGDTAFEWTHVLYVDAGVDIRDNWPSAPNSRVYVPDKNGTRFDIVFVEVVNRGTAAKYKRVYLNRQAVTWPSDEL